MAPGTLFGGEGGLMVQVRGLVRLASLVEAQRRRSVSRVVVRRGGEKLAKAMIRDVRRLG